MDYTIDIDEVRSGGDVMGTLKSQRLSTRIFGTDSVRLRFTEGARKEGKDVVLDEFVSSSIEDFLSLQESLMQTLEAALKRDRDNWKKRKSRDGEDGDIWGAVKVESLDLRKRITGANPAYAMMLKMKGPEIAARLFPMESEALKSAFTLSLRCRWDREHLVRAEFKNGELKQVDHS